jgi:hypothetical protein
MLSARTYFPIADCAAHRRPEGLGMKWNGSYIHIEFRLPGKPLADQYVAVIGRSRWRV